MFLFGCDSNVLTINDVKVKVEFAKTSEQQAKGLMFRRELCENCGMLFIFHPSRISMWMKNTYIPLDMIFAGQDGKIICIRNGVPHSLEPIDCADNIKYVLEVNAGFAKRNDIKSGDYIRGL